MPTPEEEQLARAAGAVPADYLRDLTEGGGDVSSAFDKAQMESALNAPLPEQADRVSEPVAAALNRWRASQGQGPYVPPAADRTPAPEESQAQVLPEDGPLRDGVVGEALRQAAPGRRQAIAEDVLSGRLKGIGGRARTASKRYAEGTEERAGRIEDILSGQDDRQWAEYDAGRTLESHRLGVQDARTKQMAALDAEQQQQRDAGMEAVRLSREKVDQMIGNLRNEKVDPDGFFKNADGTEDVGKRVMAALAVALGAFGSALAGTKNAAMEIINNQIDNDIAAQRSNIETKRGAVEQQRGLYNQLLDEFGTDERARLAYRAARLEHFSMQLEPIAEQAQSLEQRSKARSLMEQTQIQKEEAIQGLLKSSYDGRMQGLAFEQGNLGAQAKLKARGPAAGKTVGSADTRSIGEFSAGIKLLQDLKSSYKDKSGWGSVLNQFLPWGREPREYNDQRKIAAQIVGGIIEGGKLTDSDFDRYYDMLPEHSDSEERAESKVNTIAKQLRDKGIAGVDALERAGYNAEGLSTMFRGGSLQGASAPAPARARR